MPRCQFITIESRPFGENSYVLWLEGRSECLIVDPGLEPDLILQAVDERQFTPAAILNTHGHCDHIAGNAAMKRRWPDAPLVIGASDAVKLVDPQRNMSGKFGFPMVSPPADETVQEGDIYRAAGFALLVREIPGHSLGHVVFIDREGVPPLVLGGDVLFAGSIGRTDDMVEGSFEQLAAGIRGKLYTLPDETLVLPGHGPITTIGEEKRSNPFVPAG